MTSPSSRSRSSLTAPFHIATGSTREPAAATRRLLLVSYAFPPDSSIGALRWEKLVGYAARRGWQVDVIMMDPDAADLRDDSRLAGLPAGTRLWGVARHLPSIRVAERWLLQRLKRFRAPAPPGVHVSATAAPAWTGPIVEPGVKGRLRAARRGYLARMHYLEWSNWARDAAALGVALHNERSYDLVASSGPPQMAHDAARRIAARTGIPFVMDLRDQFFYEDTQPPELRSYTWRNLTRRYETRCVDAAALVVMNTAAMEVIMHHRYPHHAGKIMTAMNGADPDVHSAHPPVAPFTITHAGSLYNGRDPRPLFRGCRRALDLLPDVGPDRFRVCFLGGDVYEGTPVAEIAAQEGVAPYVIAEKFRPRAEAIRLQEESAVLVVLPQFQEECIPGKVFEYVQLSSWVLALTDPGTAIDLTLRDTEADVVPPSDADEVGRRIAARFRAFEGGVRPSPVNVDGRFDREAQARILFDAIDDRVLSPRSR
ncbi:MAG: hypothetical protein IT359_02760 [Gemmatimonadaceae bacterium]|nr:hypothetical protein [Gemmatimonadaceae bacterium]